MPWNYHTAARTSKTFQIVIRSRTFIVSVDRVKPAYILDGTQHVTTNTNSPPAQHHSFPATVATSATQASRATRSGRSVHFLARFNPSYSNPQTIMSEDNFRLIYYSYFHSVITYGIILWGNSSHSISVIRLQKKNN